MIKSYILVACGGAIGAMLRHGANQISLRYNTSDFPWATMSINIIGSLLIGIIVGLLAFATEWTQDIKAFVVIGIIGALTTFSAFSLDAILLWERGEVASMFLYIAGSVVISIAATYAGLCLVKAIFS